MCNSLFYTHEDSIYIHIENKNQKSYLLTFGFLNIIHFGLWFIGETIEGGHPYNKIYASMSVCNRLFHRGAPLIDRRDSQQYEAD